ncbi:MAG: preprotein translocase subunit SecG [Burkholderiaceae bacterium]
MAWFSNVLQMLQVIAALGVVILVLLQHGKGADMGAAFGGGSSGSLFGATGSANFLSRATAAFAVVFFVTTLGLAFVANKRPAAAGSVMDGAVPAAAPATQTNKADPATPAADANSQIPGSGTPESGGRSDIPK